MIIGENGKPFSRINLGGFGYRRQKTWLLPVLPMLAGGASPVPRDRRSGERDPAARFD
jgi:hypothetical protein